MNFNWDYWLLIDRKTSLYPGLGYKWGWEISNYMIYLGFVPVTWLNMHVLSSLVSFSQPYTLCNPSCSIFLDVKKAFDAITHDILLLKLGHIWAHGITCSWFHLYLSDIKILIGENPIKVFNVENESILGPMLSLIYVWYVLCNKDVCFKVLLQFVSPHLCWWTQVLVKLK